MRVTRLLFLFVLPIAALGCNQGDAADTAAPPPKKGGVVEKAEGKGSMGTEPISKSAGDQTIK